MMMGRGEKLGKKPMKHLCSHQLGLIWAFTELWKEELVFIIGLLNDHEIVFTTEI